MRLLNKLATPVKQVLFGLLGRHLSNFFSSPRLLDMQRCTREDALSSVRIAQANHPGAAIYVLSDVSLAPIPGTQHIATIKSLESAPVPSAVILACNSDELALQAVQFIKKREGMFYYGANRFAPPARYFHRDGVARQVLKEAREANLDRYELPDFENIFQVIQATRAIEGDYVEIGVYKGSSAYVALRYMQLAGVKRQCHFLDTFSGFDYDNAASSGDRVWYKSHNEASQDAVEKLLARFTVPHQVIKSNIITDSLPAPITQIAVCNIDVDMYEAVGAALAKVAPLVVEGGIIIAEDQGHTPLLIGAYAATKEFLASPQGKYFVPIEMMSGQMLLVKTRGSGAS
jgi:hypothetical protein